MVLRRDRPGLISCLSGVCFQLATHRKQLVWQARSIPPHCKGDYEPFKIGTDVDDFFAVLKKSDSMQVNRVQIATRLIAGWVALLGIQRLLQLPETSFPASRWALQSSELIECSEFQRIPQAIVEALRRLDR